MDARCPLLVFVCALACALLATACDLGSVPPPTPPDASQPDAAQSAPDAGGADAGPLASGPDRGAEG